MIRYIKGQIKLQHKQPLMQIIGAAFAVLLLGVGLVHAAVSVSYVTPFPTNGTYKVLVIGDGFAEGAWLGLRKAFKTNRKIEIFREIDYKTGLIGSGRRDWVKKLDYILSKRSYDIAVVMIGYTDRRRTKFNGQSHTMDTQEWRSFYRKRIKESLRKFASHKISVYWTGMPIVKSDHVRPALETINQMIKIQTSTAQVRYIDNWLHFSDEKGQYSQYGPDVDGKIRLLRKRDGIFFTRAGYEKLGFFIHKYIQRDLRDARAERNVPLLGNKVDQDYLLHRYTLDNPRSRRGAANKNKNKTKNNKSGLPGNISIQRSKYETAGNSVITLSKDMTYSGKELKLKIIRPAIPAAAFTISRHSIGASDGKDIAGEVLMIEKQGKSISFAIPSIVQQLSLNRHQRRIPLTQTPYYKLVVRGDAQISKPGRADHFSWVEPPKQEETSN